MFKLIEDTYYGVNDLDTILDEALKNGYSISNTQIEYENTIFAFDIETSSFTEKPTKEDHNEKRSIMYIWQLAINGRVIIGRTWNEFLYVMNRIHDRCDLTDKHRIIIWIHNFSFEFQFIRKFFEWKKVFAIDNRKPIYGITVNGFEFRCSYILTNYSLAKLSDQLHKYHVSKMVGDLDYSLVRTPLTPLTDKEMQYCINDVLVVSAYIKECCEQEGNITRIPLTATGYCRRYVRHNCLYKGGKKHKEEQFNKYHTLMLSMQIQDVEEYKQLKRAFMGGFTHAAANYSSYTLENVDSIDFTSSYPYVMLSEQFPMSSGKIITIHNKEELHYYLKYYCCVFDCEFHDLEPTFDQESYISLSKCFQKTAYIANNGRCFKAGIIQTTLTNIDFEIINATYKYSHCKIWNFRIYKKGYLPKEFIEAIIKLYKDKTTLKGVAGKEVEYQQSKALLNACYGMCCTDIIKDMSKYDNDKEWYTEAAEPEKELKRYNRSRRRFLFYTWSVFVTAYARKNLWTGIIEFGKKKHYLYSDTDSCKVLHIEEHFDYIRKYNAACEKKLQKMCKHYDIPYSELLPKTIKGEVKPLGVWDWETEGNIYKKFKTLGAKRYMVYQGDKLSITVSGVNKKTAVPYMTSTYSIDECFNAFNEGLIIPEEYTGKLTHYYIDKPYRGTVSDYRGIKYDYEALSGIYLEPASYQFDPMTEYIEFLKGYFYTK